MARFTKEQIYDTWDRLKELRSFLWLMQSRLEDISAHYLGAVSFDRLNQLDDRFVAALYEVDQVLSSYAEAESHKDRDRMLTSCEQGHAIIARYQQSTIERHINLLKDHAVEQAGPAGPSKPSLHNMRLSKEDDSAFMRFCRSALSFVWFILRLFLGVYALNVLVNLPFLAAGRTYPAPGVWGIEVYWGILALYAVWHLERIFRELKSRPKNKI